jgi:hypothetical protein
MRTKLWLGVILSTSALAACGGGGDDPDAPVNPNIDSPTGSADASPDGRPDADPLAPDASPAWACYMQPIPGTAPATLTVAGDMQSLGVAGGTPVSGATVSAFIAGNPTAVAMDTTDGTGAYSIAVDNPGGTPVDAYLRAPSPNNKTVYLFPPTLIYEDIPMAPIRTIADNLFGTFLALAQADPITPGNGVIALVVADCEGNPLEGATVSSPGNPAAQIRYNGTNGLPSGAATATAADGIGYIINVPPGAQTVDAIYMGMDLREHTITVHAVDGAENAINTTVVRP